MILSKLNEMLAIIEAMTPEEVAALVEKCGITKESCSQYAMLERMLLEKNDDTRGS